jgi:alpha-amylase/alpha-mannosidase (GH57 family)
MGYVCVHGHFYQPPRENPWLEAVELQDSAYPYHDWNERITAECYAPNSAARIQDEEGRIIRIVNNYERISFNFGPTLLSWIETQAPRVYRAILEADQASKQRFSGHGSALAQAYHHLIMPLANQRDKYTQVVWGIQDFEHRFGRTPEGMWLPETAVDIETLEILAELGIKFTILAPRQARRVSKIGGQSWKDVSGERIDPSMPYVLSLPSSRKISVFFYDGPISRSVAFEDLLADGERFGKRLMAGFAEELRPWPELIHIAVDGETYGHHHRFGEMGLASALNYIESNQLAQLTNYGEYLERHPPIHRVEIFENSSWSCVHGIERWRSNCGCNSGCHAHWNQNWRQPLREAFDWLRDTLAPKFEQRAQTLLKDPWAARNQYIDVMLDRSEASIDRFLMKHTVRELDQKERVLVLKLLELQRHTMLMYTSCGWFFDELSGIETVQVLRYAGRAVELAEQVFGDHLEASFLERLMKAKSNLSEYGDGARIYETLVKASAVDLLKVGSHYAVSDVLEPHDDRTQVYCYQVERKQQTVLRSGARKLVLGKAVFTSTVTWEYATLEYGVLHFGGYNVVAGVRIDPRAERDRAVVNELVDAFSQSDDADLRVRLKHVFGEVHSFTALFKDRQRKMLGFLSNSAVAEIEAAHRQIYERHAELMRLLIDSGMPLPRDFRASAESALNSFLREAVAVDEPEAGRVERVLKEAKALGIALDAATLEFVVKKKIESMAEVAATDFANIVSVVRLQKAVALLRSLPFPVDLWWVQTLCYKWIGEAYGGFLEKAEKGNKDAQAWTAQVAVLSEQLGFLSPDGSVEVLRPASPPLP